MARVETRDATRNPRLNGARKVTTRKKLRRFFEELRVEVTIMVFVIIYALFIFIDLAIATSSNCQEQNVTLDDGEVEIRLIQTQTVWDQIFAVVDWGFLTAFIIELVLKLFAWGPITYLKNCLDAFDAVVVVISYAFVVVFTSGLIDTCSAGANAATIAALARLVRLVRIFRLMTVMNKIQKSRASAHVLRKKQKYKKLGSPVEKVLEILVRLKKDPLESSEDRENIAFIMDIIISDQLYAINVGNLGKDMLQFVGQGTAVDVFAVQAQKRRASKEKVVAGGGKMSPDEATLMASANGAARRTSVTQVGDASLWVDKLIAGDEMAACLEHVDSWDFDFFAFERQAGKHPLVVMVLHVIRLNGLEDSLGLNLGNVVRFLSKLEAGYMPREDVPFHNRSHAADVVQSTAFLLNQDALKVHLQPLDVYALILSAAMHDHGHPGLTNAFLVHSRHELAILYNDASVLEMHHLASSWNLLLAAQSNPLDGLSLEQYNEVRQTIIHVILGTDMKYHFDHLTKFKTRRGAGAFEEPERKDVKLMLAMCLHSADVSNPAKPWRLSCEWSARVMDEFFRQGDTETSRGMPISPFMDREKTDIAKCQVGFINILIKPFFEEWASFLGAQGTQLTDNITANIAKWETEGEKALGKERVATIKAPPKLVKRVAVSPDLLVGSSQRETHAEAADDAERSQAASPDAPVASREPSPSKVRISARS